MKVEVRVEVMTEEVRLVPPLAESGVGDIDERSPHDVDERCTITPHAQDEGAQHGHARHHQPALPPLPQLRRLPISRCKKREQVVSKRMTMPAIGTAKRVRRSTSFPCLASSHVECSRSHMFAYGRWL